MSRYRRLLIAATVVGGLIAGTVAVGALRGTGSREFSQSTSGVTGSAETGDFFASELAIGDFDNDGFGDVLAAAPHEDLGSKLDAGQIQVLYGSRAGVSTAGDAVIHQGTRRVVGKSIEGDLFGSALAVGDFNNDGYDDAAVGIPGKTVADQADAGWVTILYGGERGLRGNGSHRIGQDSASVDGDPDVRDYFGHSLASGDFNNDGFDDVAVGAPSDSDPGVDRAGSVTVLFGSADGVVTAGSQLLHQGLAEVAETPEAGDSFGWALTAGDFNDDGLDDLAVAAPGESIGEIGDAGVVHVFAGSAEGISLAGNQVLSEDTPGVPGVPEANDRFGTSLAAGDFDGGGTSDLVIGVPGESKGSRVSSGVVQVLPGVAGVGVTGADTKRLSQASKGVPGKPQAGDGFGHHVAVGDFNDNGRDDLAVGVPGESLDSLTGAGSTHVFFGGPSGIRTKNDEQWHPGQNGMAGTGEANAGVGRALAVGDINGDDRADLVIAAPGRTAGGDNTAGSFIVLFG